MIDFSFYVTMMIFQLFIIAFYEIPQLLTSFSYIDNQKLFR